jgi:hypothetical protein
MRFLSFYRVIEVAIGKGKRRQIDWINDEIAKGLGNLSKDAIAELTQQGIANIGGHLYESGRCAMAHAAEEPIIDPDDPTDSRRLWSERPIMLALAERAIEQKLGVETSLTVYRNHFYELVGFKRILGDEIVACLVRGDELGYETTVDIPDISIRIRRKQAYPSLSRLTVREMTRGKHSVHLKYVLNDSDGDPLVEVFLTLDFAEERLKFSLFKDIFYRDSGSAEGAELVADLLRFQTDLFGNGQLQIFDADSGELISRKDAYIPLNMIHNPDGTDAHINHWKTIAAERRARDERFGREMARLSQCYDISLRAAMTVDPS